MRALGVVLALLAAAPAAAQKDAKAVWSSPDPFGWVALRAEQGKWPDVKVALGAPDARLPAAGDSEGKSRLYRLASTACSEGKAEVVRRISELGGLNHEIACALGNKAWAELAALHASPPKLAAGAPADAVEAAFREACPNLLRGVAREGQEKLAKELLAGRCKGGRSDAVVGALTASRLPLAQELLGAAPLEAREADTIVEAVCFMKDAAVFTWVKQRNIDVKRLTKPATCLHRAIGFSTVEVVKHLLDLGSDLAAKDSDGKTPLELAVEQSRPEMVEAMLKKGADAGAVRARALELFKDPSPYAPFGVTLEELRERRRKVVALVSPGKRTVLIFGGGTTAEEGQAQLALWYSLAPSLAKLFVVPKGFPRVVESAQVPGLKPGFHVVLLGACQEFESEAVLPALQAIRPGAYVRIVEWSPPDAACLGLAVDAGTPSAQTKKLGAQTLGTVEYGGGGRAVAALWDKAGALVHHADLDLAEQCVSFETQGLTPVAGGFDLEANCSVPACTTPDEYTVTGRLRVKADRIDYNAKSRLVSRGQCD